MPVLTTVIPRSLGAGGAGLAPNNSSGETSLRDILDDHAAAIEAHLADGNMDTLASTDPGDGASLIGVEDADGNFTGGTVEAALQELADADALIQRGTLTLASGTGTVNAGITITASSRIVIGLRSRPTGSTNFAGIAVVSSTTGAPGVAAFTVEAIVAAGTIDNDAAATVDWAIYD